MLWRGFFALAAFSAVELGSGASARDFAFFNILQDGKASKEAIGAHCAQTDGWVRSFSSASLNLAQKEANQRISFRGQQFTNVNASPGEWTMEVYKTLCPGLYTFTLDYVSAPKEGGTPGDIAVKLYVWRKNASGPRPGDVVAEAHKIGKGRGAGHATVTLAMGTGDEITAYAISADGKPVFFERIQLNSHRAHHMPQLAVDFDSTWWEAETTEAAKHRVLDIVKK